MAGEMWMDAKTCLLALMAGVLLAWGGGDLALAQSDEAGVEPGETAGEPGERDPAPESPAEGVRGKFLCRDGTILYGALNQEFIDVRTVYGELHVPVSDVAKIRLGKRSNPELVERIAVLIEELGSGEFAVRQKASKELVEIGPDARPELEAAARCDDAEVKSRADQILKKIRETHGGLEVLEDDEIVTVSFTIRGELLVEQMRVETRYGVFSIAKRDLESVLFSRQREQSLSVEVGGDALAANSNLKRIPIELSRGDRLVVKASGVINLTDWGRSFGPDGSTRIGQYTPGIPLGALVGQLGESGKLFLIGSKFDQPVTESGELRIGIALQQQYAQMGIAGEFDVSIQVLPGSE